MQSTCHMLVSSPKQDSMKPPIHCLQSIQTKYDNLSNCD